MKRGQLAFFGFQLACMVFFLIVLFSILFMKRHLWFTLKEFEAQTIYSVGSRTLLSTPECLAREEVYYYKDSNGRYQVLRRVYPGQIDFDKYVDVVNFNCLRKDFVIEKGGASYRYCILVLDSATNKSWANYIRYTSDNKAEAPFYKCSLVESKLGQDGEVVYTPKAVYLSEDDVYQICPSPYRTYGFTLGYVNGALRPVFVLIDQCILSNEYEGRSFCEVELQVTKK